MKSLCIVVGANPRRNGGVKSENSGISIGDKRRLLVSGINVGTPANQKNKNKQIENLHLLSFLFFLPESFSKALIVFGSMVP
jgi:hypothetical protein